MNRVITYITGRTLSLILNLGFNILLVKTAVASEYAIYAVLAAGASIANTAAGLGTQRLVPKVVGMAGRSISYARARRIYAAILAARVAALLAISALTFTFYRWFTSEHLAIGAALFLPYLGFSIFSSLYLDVETASQSLNQQRLSRIVAIGEPTMRLALIVTLAFTHSEMTAFKVITASALTQALSTIALGANNFRFFHRARHDPPSAPQPVALGELLHLGVAAYLSGFAWISTAPPTLRLIAASMLPPPAIAVLSFVQSLGTSFTRYMPGILMLPFAEAQIMRRSNESGRILVAAALGLVWKIDLVISMLLICAITPVAPMLLALAAKPNFAPYGMYVGLVLLPIPLGTIYRTLEVGSVFINAYGQILRASALCLISFVLLIVGRGFGIFFILLIPVLDNLIRCGYLGFQLHRRGLEHIVQWPSLLAVLTAGIAVTGSAHWAIFLSPPMQVGLAILATVAGLVLVRLLRVITPAETALICDRLPRAVAPWAQKLIGPSTQSAAV